MRLAVATMNRHKFEEISRILSESGAVLVPLWEIEGAVPAVEDEDTFEGNAAAKALAASSQSGLPALADDSGLSVDALGGLPGVHSARYAGPAQDGKANIAKLLAEMKHLETEAERLASFVCAAAVARSGRIVFAAKGRTKGRILHRPDGDGGFGYDPVFHSLELGMSFGRALPEDKDRISHRGRAFADVRDFIMRDIARTR